MGNFGVGPSWEPHVGTQQRKRHMRQRVQPILKHKDAKLAYVRGKLVEAVYGGMDDPYHELYPVICHLLAGAEERSGSPATYAELPRTSNMRMEILTEWVASVMKLLDIPANELLGLENGTSIS